MSLELLNQFLADLNVFYRKLQNYHWNIQGKDFFQEKFIVQVNG